MSEELKDGDVFKIPAPYIKEESVFEGYSWRHGIDFEYDEYSTIGFADAEGIAEYKVIKVVEMPKPFATRILYRKRLTNPDGDVLKWSELRMIGPIGFESLKTGKKWNYELA